MTTRQDRLRETHKFIISFERISVNDVRRYIMKKWQLTGVTVDDYIRTLGQSSALVVEYGFFRKR